MFTRLKNHLLLTLPVLTVGLCICSLTGTGDQGYIQKAQTAVELLSVSVELIKRQSEEQNEGG